MSRGARDASRPPKGVSREAWALCCWLADEIERAAGSGGKVVADPGGSTRARGFAWLVTFWGGDFDRAEKVVEGLLANAHRPSVRRWLDEHADCPHFYQRENLNIIDAMLRELEPLAPVEAHSAFSNARRPRRYIPAVAT